MRCSMRERWILMTLLAHMCGGIGPSPHAKSQGPGRGAGRAVHLEGHTVEMAARGMLARRDSRVGPEGRQGKGLVEHPRDHGGHATVMREWCGSAGCIGFWDVQRGGRGGHEGDGMVGQEPAAQGQRGGEGPGRDRGGSMAWNDSLANRLRGGHAAGFGAGGGGRSGRGGGGWGSGGGRHRGGHGNRGWGNQNNNKMPQKRWGSKPKPLYTIGPDDGDQILPTAEELREQAIEAVVDQDFRAALRLSLKAEELSPASPHLPLATAVLMHEIGDIDGAETKLRAHLEWLPQYAPAMCSLASICANERGNFEEADGLLLRAVEVCGEDPAVHAARGDFLHNMQRIEEAEACYQAALGLKPDHAGAVRGLGAVSWKGRGQLESGYDMLQRSLIMNPRDPDTLMLLAEISVEMGRIEEAEGLYDSAYVAQVNHPELLLSHGRFLYEIKRDFTAAEHKLGYALSLRPNDTRVMMQVARFRLMVSKDLAGAEILLNRTIELEPQNAMAYANLALIRCEEMDAEAAASYFKTAVDMLPPGEKGAVLSTYATMISELVDEPGVKLRWGDYACQGCSAPVRGWGGKTAKDLADSLFRLATEDSPGCVPAWYNYGVFLSEHNDKGKLLPQARDVLQQAIALEPSHLDALELVASVHQMLKDGPAAERALRSAIELQDVDDPCRVELVASYIQLLATWPGQERYSDAAELLYRAEEMQPGHPQLAAQKNFLNLVCEGRVDEVYKERDEGEDFRNRVRARMLLTDAIQKKGKNVESWGNFRVTAGGQSTTLLFEGIRTVSGCPDERGGDVSEAVAGLLSACVHEKSLSPAQVGQAIAAAVSSAHLNSSAETASTSSALRAPPCHVGEGSAGQGARIDANATTSEIGKVYLGLPRFSMPLPPGPSDPRGASPWWDALPSSLDSQSIQATPHMACLSPLMRRLAVLTGYLYANSSVTLAPIARALAGPPSLPSHTFDQLPTLRSAFAATVNIAITSAWRAATEDGTTLPGGSMWGTEPRNGTAGGDDGSLGHIPEPDCWDPNWEEFANKWSKVPDWGSSQGRFCARLCKRAHSLLNGLYLVEPYA